MGQFEENMKKSDVYTKIADAGRLGLMVTLTPKRAEITADTLLTMARTIDEMEQANTALKLVVAARNRVLHDVPAPGFGEEHGVVPSLSEYEAPKDYPDAKGREPQRYTAPSRPGAIEVAGIFAGIASLLLAIFATFNYFAS